MENGIKHIRGTGRERVYRFIVDFITENSYSPSVKEICEGTGLSSTSNVHDYLRKLKMMGKIDMKERTPRTIRLVVYKTVKVEEIR